MGQAGNWETDAVSYLTPYTQLTVVLYSLSVGCTDWPDLCSTYTSDFATSSPYIFFTPTPAISHGEQRGKTS